MHEIYNVSFFWIRSESGHSFPVSG